MGAKGIVEASLKGPPVAISIPEYPLISMYRCSTNFQSGGRNVSFVKIVRFVFIRDEKEKRRRRVIDFRVVMHNKCVRAMNKRSAKISMRDMQGKNNFVEGNSS